MKTQKPLLKDEDRKKVDVHMYRSMIGSLMYLTSSRPDIMFAVCACARYQVNPKVLHLHAVKRIFRYLKGQPKLGLWYPKDSPFDLVAYTDSDYARASLDRKSTTGGCQFLSSRLISWQFNAVRHNLLLMLEVNAARHNLLLLLKVNAARHKLTTASEPQMANLKFADTHNMVACLAKPAESKGFEQIATVKAKTVNGEVQLQAPMDGKKIIITESTVRRDLQLEDAEGVDCPPNATIFEQLTRMGSKTTAWNEFSNTMASAIICLATNQKFNFSNYIFESMVKNFDNVSGIFLMYPRFVQVFVNQQLEGMPTHKRIYIAPSHTKKIFGNMIRVGKGFSRRETRLFQTMMVQDQEEVGESSEMPTDPHHTPTIIQPSTSQPQKKQRSRRSKRKDTEVPQPSGPTTNVADEAVNEEMDDSLERAATTATGLEAEQDSGSGPRRQETMGDTIAQTRSENVSKLSNDPLLARGITLRSGEDSLKLQELMALCTTLQSRVLALETTKTTQATEIAILKKRVKKLERRNKSRTHGLKRLYKVSSSRRVESSKDEDLDMFGVNDLDGDEVIVESVDVVKTAEEIRSMVEEVTAVTIPVSAATTTTTTTTITNVEMTLAQALAELKSAKPKATTITTTPTLTTTAAITIIAISTRPKAKGIVIHEQEQAPTPTVSSQQPS
ncbi:hypothetical protein Tco_0611749 [Tanacetum coccineum]